MDYQEAIEVLNNHERYVGVKYVNGVEEAYVTPYFEKALDTAISAMQELQAIHNNGISLERLKDIDFRKQVVERINYMEYMSVKDELEEYKQLGTLEEVREAAKRHKEIKPIEMVHDSDRIFDMGKSYNCHMCGSGLRYRYSVCEPIDNYCAICGQKIDWSEENEIN